MLDVWHECTLEFVANDYVATVYLKGEAVWAVKHNDSYWQWARLDPLNGSDVLSLESRVARLEDWARSMPTFVDV
jgi:hypothetical protein